MRRRSLLSALGTATAGSLAGCAAEAGDEAATDATESPTETSTESPTETSTDAPRDPSFDPASDEPAWSLSLGDRDAVAFPENNRPIRARVWNDGPARDIRVEVTRDGEEDAPLHVEAVSVEADAFLTITFEEPGRYALRVGVDDVEAELVAEYDRATFDCNETITTVQVADDGSVAAETERTDEGCPAPSVADVAFEQAETGDCGGEQSASASVDDDVVVVEGRIVTPVPCYDLALEAVDYDPDEDRLTVDVAPDERHDGICTECVGVVPYEATVAFEHALPGEARVRHREDDELVTVTTTSP